MLFTVAIGALPIFARLMSATAPSHGDEAIPQILVSDVVFFGLMFNAATVANVVAERDNPLVYLITIGVVAILSCLLVAFYVFDMHKGMCPTAMWAGLSIVLAVSAFVSWLATNSDFVQGAEKVLH